MKTVLVTGSQGFIGSYVVSHLLDQGFRVVGVDDFSKYGPVVRAHDNHHNFSLHRLDIACHSLWPILEASGAEYVIAGAAKIGGISYFHEFAYDLLATNERITANTFDACLRAWKAGTLKKVVVLSSSMVYESAYMFPVREDDIAACPPPVSSYGFQKLATEYFARAAFDQHGLPYTIVRPFNCVGVGEDKAITSSTATSGNIKLTLSHVLPDLVVKVLGGQNPLHILGDGKQVRCYTNGRDIARGICLAMTSDKAVNEAFNISTPAKTTVLELADLVWRKIRRTDDFRFVSDPPYKHDVQFRLPDCTKAKELLGFEATIGLEESVDEVIDYIRTNHW